LGFGEQQLEIVKDQPIGQMTVPLRTRNPLITSCQQPKNFLSAGKQGIDLSQYFPVII